MGPARDRRVPRGGPCNGAAPAWRGDRGRGRFDPLGRLHRSAGAAGRLDLRRTCGRGRPLRIRIEGRETAGHHRGPSGGSGSPLRTMPSGPARVCVQRGDPLGNPGGRTRKIGSPASSSFSLRRLSGGGIPLKQVEEETSSASRHGTRRTRGNPGGGKDRHDARGIAFNLDRTDDLLIASARGVGMTPTMW